jgi:hypothetical protein
MGRITEDARNTIRLYVHACNKVANAVFGFGQDRGCLALEAFPLVGADTVNGRSVTARQ